MAVKGVHKGGGAGRVLHAAVLLAVVVGGYALKRAVSPAGSPAGSPAAVSPLAADATPASCTTWRPSSGTYSLELCLTAPGAGSRAAGDVPVRATLQMTGSGPNVRRVMFELDGAYVISDYEAPYTFTLPTREWPDGSHVLSAQAVVSNGFTSRASVLPLTFANGKATATGAPAAWQAASGRPANGGPFVVAAAGDGASGQRSSAGVAARLRAVNPNLFLYLGDVYEQGTFTEFLNWYGGANSFGALRAITDPTPGNHEYLTEGASGYFRYWAGIPPYYSVEAGGWHIISLNSSKGDVPAAEGSRQYNWLKADLAGRAPGTCTLAYFHRPVFNVGPEGSAPWMVPIWKLLAQSGVEMVLNGHDHDYQRWQPLDGAGNASASGVTEFVVGGGGHGVQHFIKTDARVAYSNDKNPAGFGALVLELGASGASFKYVNSAGAVLDSGFVPCK